MAGLRHHGAACLPAAPDRPRNAGGLRSRNADCGVRSAELRIGRSRQSPPTVRNPQPAINPQSAIRNPQSIRHPPSAIRNRELAQRADLGTVALPAAADQSSRRRHRGRGHRHRREVRLPHQGQAHLQPHQRRHRRDDAADRSRLGVARPVGIGGVLRLPDGVPGRRGRHPRVEKRRDLRVHRLLLRAALRPVGVSRRADGDPAPPSPERRAAALHLFHDFRPEDHARFSRRPGAVRRARRHGRMVRAVPVVQDQRAALVAGRLLAGGAAHRSVVTRRALRMDESQGATT
jgi:hypothetical protein